MRAPRCLQKWENCRRRSWVASLLQLARWGFSNLPTNPCEPPARVGIARPLRHHRSPHATQHTRRTSQCLLVGPPSEIRPRMRAAPALNGGRAATVRDNLGADPLPIVFTLPRGPCAPRAHRTECILAGPLIRLHARRPTTKMHSFCPVGGWLAHGGVRGCPWRIYQLPIPRPRPERGPTPRVRSTVRDAEAGSVGTDPQAAPCKV